MSAELPRPLLALLENIKNHADDDSRRFALADWVEQHGQDDAERARGHFIRLQCRRARLNPGNSLHEELESQEQALRREYMVAWLGDWQPWITRPDNEAHWFQRGLLRPWVKGLQWLELEAVPRDTATWAWVDGLAILDLGLRRRRRTPCGLTRPQGDDLAAFWTRRLGRQLRVRRRGRRALASSPHLTRLRSLRLGDTDLGPEGFRTLVQSPPLGHLTSLKLTGSDCTKSNHIGDEGARALAEATHMTNLSCLWLMENCIGADGARELAGAAHLDSLTDLDLASNPIGPAGALAVASSPFLSRLTRLCLHVTADPYLSGGFGVKASEQEPEQARAALRQRFGAAWLGPSV